MSDATEIAGAVAGLKALDDEHLRSPFNACSLKSRCIQTADALDRQHDGHAEFVRAVKDDATAAECYLSLDGKTRNWAAFMAAQRILALCDAELAKEQP